MKISTPTLGQKWNLPVGIAPSAMQQLVHDDGEKATAAAAKIAGYKAVALTVDTPIAGTRPALIKSKFVMPKHLKFKNFTEDFGGPLDQVSAAVADAHLNEADPDAQKQKSKRSQLGVDPSINWERDMKWLKENTNMEIWVKGVLHPLDADEAIKHGAKGIIVSNHGGRQLDGSISALDALPGIVKIVKGRVPVHVDGGVRRGADIFKALALGADFVWIGRPIWWGLYLDGERGVRWVLETLERELKVVMMCMGCRSLKDIKREMVMPKALLPSMGGAPLW
ncbi:hypothetical protein ABW19_dt0207548 [Dactylella cylindrospora]|nr:hypothetical protein ABW19_dt0207548 [Dactylella cylindrospora]